MFNFKFISFYIGQNIGWIRVFGIGFTWKDSTKYPLMYSERFGQDRFIQIGRWKFRYLPRFYL